MSCFVFNLKLVHPTPKTGPNSRLEVHVFLSQFINPQIDDAMSLNLIKKLI